MKREKKFRPAAVALLAVSVCVTRFMCAPLVDPAGQEVHITVSVRGNGVVTGISADTIILRGTVLRLTAVPGPGSVFTGWGGIAFTTANPLSVVAERECTIEARFAPKPGNLVHFHAYDSTFSMGSAGASSQEYEKPVHQVRFRHDFFIGSHEVTQGEYAALMGRIPATDPGAVDIGDSFPVFSVAWYDAALYCNRRSRREGYDTVYSYTAVCSSPSCPFVLENLEIHYDRFGYRLPTEAEWEYACRAGSKKEYYWGDRADSASGYTWYYVNSGGQSQRVKRLQPNAFGLFDMAGNVAEWVNDWLDYYPDSTAADPVGPASLKQEQYEAAGERPVRGGSWRLGTDLLRSANRRGPYRTSAFSSFKDIGFRVALGAFSAGAEVPRRASQDTIPVSLTCSKTDLFNFIGTSTVKLGLVVKQGERRNLVFIDFGEAGAEMRRCGSDTTVFDPAISPDGSFVAYSSQGEGFSGPGRLTVCRLDSAGSGPARENGYLPRFWVSPSSKDTFIIFTDGASLNSQPRWFSEKTWRQRFSAGKLSSAPEVLWQVGSYHGGLSSDGRFLGTSYPVSKVVDLQLGDSAIHYFYNPLNGRLNDQQVLPQICNQSMSPSFSEPGEALLLDFGYQGTSALLGKPYGLHAVIFICNARVITTTHVSKWFEKPAGYAEWDHPDWSNNSGFIVSIARSSPGDEAVYIINRKDSTYLKVLTGRNLLYPALWIDPAKVPEVNDPWLLFGAYDVPVQWEGQVGLAKKLRLFWRHHDSVECVAVGSSPFFWGFNPAHMTRRTINVSCGGSDVFTDVAIARDYVLPHSPRLKTIVFDLTPGFLNRDFHKEPPRLNGLYDSKGYELDRQNGFYRGGIPQPIAAKAATLTSASWSGFDSNGYELTGNTGTGWGQPSVDRADYDFNEAYVQASLSELENLADSAASRGVQLIIVSMPENPQYATETTMIGRYGPSRETYGKLTGWIDELMQRNPFVHFYDANDYGNHDYDDSEALDCNHLNHLGAVRFTERVDSLVTLYTQ